MAIDKNRLEVGKLLGRLALFELAYLIAYRFGMSFTQEFAAPFWFPDAVLLTALLLSRRQDWLLFVFGTIPIRLVFLVDPGLPFWFLVATCLNDSVKAVLSAWLLSSTSRTRIWFENLSDFGQFVLIAVVLLPGFSAFAGAASRVYLGDTFWVAWRNWFLGDALASIILTPLLIVLLTARWNVHIHSVVRLTECFLATTGLLVAGYLALQGGISGFPQRLLYLPVPFLLWIAVRFAPGGAPVSLLLITVPAILGTVGGRGPFHLQTAADSLLSIQLFLFVVSVPFMFLSVLIAQQHKTDAALRESEARFRSLVDAGPVMVWLSDSNGLCSFCNKPWLDFTGRPLVDQLGNGWAESVHPEDHHKCVSDYLAAFQMRRAFTMEYRLLRRDGAYRWIVDQGVPRYDSDGSFLGYVGSCIDITDRKEAENRLREFNSQIIKAQEAERSRIAQELHDDLAQRTALLSMRLHSLYGQCGIDVGLQDEVHELRRSAAELSKDIARIARQLHPGMVEKLGLLSSLRTLCAQSNSADRVVTFICAEQLPPFGVEVSLALYRIAQESLRNVMTHSAASQVVIEVKTKSTAIQLSIRDNGSGFDVGPSPGFGLGLSGMTERMKNVGGTLNILSERGQGTTVIATVPIVKRITATNY